MGNNSNGVEPDFKKSNQSEEEMLMQDPQAYVRAQMGQPQPTNTESPSTSTEKLPPSSTWAHRR